jgi:hypothetical protein
MTFNPWEAHHLYWGLLLILLGIFFPVARPVLWSVGGVLVLDDIIQHAAECPSPINLLFKWAWRKIFGNWWPFGRL